MIHGSKDQVTNPEDSLKFFNSVGSKDKCLKIYEDGYHQMHDDNELLNLQKYVYNWCKLRAKKHIAFSNFHLKNYFKRIFFRWYQKFVN